MSFELISGEKAIAFGALAAQVKFAIGSPGIPGARIIEYLLTQIRDQDIEVQWAGNEQWALEEAFGISLLGVRSLINLETSNFITVLDNIQSLFYDDLKAGMVLLMGDNREIIRDGKSSKITFIEKLPLFEPASPTEAFEMTLEAFRLSENYKMPVIIRINNSFCQYEEKMSVHLTPSQPGQGGHSPGIEIPFTIRVNPLQGFEQHRRKLSEISQLFERSPYNRTQGRGSVGILAVGLAYQKTMDVLATGDSQNKFCVLKLGALSPLPEATIGYFLENVKSAIIFEENEPLLEKQIRTLAKNEGIATKILGRNSGHLQREKTLYHWQIEEILATIQPAFRPNKRYFPFQKKSKYFVQPDHCYECSIKHLFEFLLDNFKENTPYIIKNSLCNPIFNTTDFPHLFTPYPAESVIGIATGIARMNTHQDVVVLIDAPAFIRNGINSLIHTSHLKTNILILIIEHHLTRHSKNARYKVNNELVPINLSIEDLIQVCKVDLVKIIDTKKQEHLQHELLEAYHSKGLRLIIFKNYCPFAGNSG